MRLRAMPRNSLYVITFRSSIQIGKFSTQNAKIHTSGFGQCIQHHVVFSFLLIINYLNTQTSMLIRYTEKVQTFAPY